MSVVGSIPMHFRQSDLSSAVQWLSERWIIPKEAKMFGIGMPELLVILVIILIIFGAGKLPQIGEGLGKGIRNFRKATAREPEEVDATAKKLEEKKADEATDKK
jgi:sec-independent protein translocase protein TatA